MQNSPSLIGEWTMHKRITIVTDKPSVSRSIAQIASKKYPHAEITFVHTLGLGLYWFNYPKQIKMDEVPFIQQPQWKLRQIETNAVKVLEIRGDEFVFSNHGVKETLNRADEIICAVDFDPTGVHAFQTLIAQSCGEEALKRPMKVVQLYAFTEQLITEAFDKNFSNKDDLFMALYEQAKIKRYFEFNFNVNSAVLFGRALGNVGIDRSAFILSKYSLAILYYLKNIDHLFLDEMLNRMHGKWEGTGKYQKGSIGSVTSRAEMISKLIDIGLLDLNDKNISLSIKGRDFLSKLHPDCCDLDLPFRIDLWCKEGNTAYPKINRYIRTLFGKQKKFAY